MGNPIAISVDSMNGLGAKLFGQFGRAPAFLVVDSENFEILTQLDNEGAQAAHGAGTSAAGLVAKHGVTAVISGKFGPKAYQALDSLGIEMWMAPDDITPRESLEMLASGQLEKMKLKVF